MKRRETESRDRARELKRFQGLSQAETNHGQLLQPRQAAFSLVGVSKGRCVLEGVGKDMEAPGPNLIEHRDGRRYTVSFKTYSI